MPYCDYNGPDNSVATQLEMHLSQDSVRNTIVRALEPLQESGMGID